MQCTHGLRKLIPKYKRESTARSLRGLLASCSSQECKLSTVMRITAAAIRPVAYAVAMAILIPM
jgi:hypothetical protein